MIVTVSLNPSMDKTGKLDRFEHGGVNHITDIIRDAAGHGIIAAKTIKALDRDDELIATGFLGGINGERIRLILEGLGIKTDFVTIAGNTRTNLKVVESNGFISEFNEPGPAVNDFEIEALKAKIISYAGPETVFIFSGSILPGCPVDIYHGLVEEVKAKGSKVVMDVDAPVLKAAVDAQPDIIKPDKKQLEEFYGYEFAVAEEGMIDMAKRIVAEKGVGMVCVSRGALGALFITADKCYRCPAPRIIPKSTVGAGAAMNAAMALGLQNGCTTEDTIKLAMAISVGACTTEGTKPPTKEVVDEFIEKIVLEEI